MHLIVHHLKLNMRKVLLLSLIITLEATLLLCIFKNSFRGRNFLDQDTSANITVGSQPTFDSDNKKGPFNYEKWYIDPNNITEPKKTIKLKIVDFWEHRPSNNNPNCMLCGYLKKYYNLNFTDEPDFVFYSIAGKEHLKYNNCVKILVTSENLVPNFNYCDYAVSYNYMDLYGRNFKGSVLDGREFVYEKFGGPVNLPQNMAQRKFCNFVYKNRNKDLEGVKLREKFFKLLSRYKHIDSPGRVFNNMKNAISPRRGRWQFGKIDFIKNYKFTIAFENTNSDGYTTEKLTDALYAHTIPIYFGNPSVGLEYNKKAFIHVNDYASLEDVAKKVIELDNDDDAYMAMLNEQPLLYPEYNYAEEMEKFFVKIIERGNKPFTKDPLGYSVP